MTTRLSCDFVAVASKKRREFLSANVPGELQTGMTSSLTKWSRITRGRACSSK